MPTPYVKQTWVDGVAGGTPISAARLSYIEDGIENATVVDGTLLPAAESGRVWNALLNGVTGDAVELADVVMAAGSSILDCPTANFTAADIGKLIAVMGVGSGGGIGALTSSLNPIVEVNSPTQIVMTKTSTVATVAARTVADGAITTGVQTLTSATAAFTGGDVGKSVTIAGAGETGRKIVTEFGAIASGTAVLTAPYACFPTSIVGKKVQVSCAGTAGAILTATVLSRTSGLSITLDTNAATTVTEAVVQSYTVADLVTEITRFTNSTTVNVRNHASATVSGATVSIGGHAAVYGTNDIPALQALHDLAEDGDTIWFDRGMSCLLGQSTWNITKQLRVTGASNRSSLLHWAVTSGRIAGLAHNVVFDNIGMKALTAGASANCFAAAAAGPVWSGWKFYNVFSDGVRLNHEVAGTTNSDGTILASGSNIGRSLTFRDLEMTRVATDGALYLYGVDSADVDNAWLHHNGIDSGTGDQLKVAGGSTGVRIFGGVYEWGSRDGIDTYDAAEASIDGTIARHNAGYGIEGKWTTVGHYNATGRHQYSNITAWNNLGGMHTGTHRSLVTNILLIANRGNGLRLGGATDTSSSADPTREPCLSQVVALGNAGYGVIAANGVRRLIAASIQCHNNAVGASFDVVGSSITGVRAFGNTTKGVEITATSTDVVVADIATQDANGACDVLAGATRVLVNGRGQQAAGVGVAPSGWPIGAAVRNTDDNTIWHNTLAGWVKQADASASIIKRKTADQAFVDTTQTDISGLSFAIAANEAWQFEASVIYDSTLANDFQLAITVPAGCTLQWEGLGISAGATSAVSSVSRQVVTVSGSSLSPGGMRAAGAAAIRTPMTVHGTVVNGATAGTVQLRANKLANTDATTPADDMTVFANSYLRASRIDA